MNKHINLLCCCISQLRDHVSITVLYLCSGQGTFPIGYCYGNHIISWYVFVATHIYTLHEVFMRLER